ncbi:MAG: cyclodeaminase/cyclohydrolase family protein [Chthoniobacter sp.]|nr:cyclodeaminase/cyclohydrolase family protein [Chthoniobacter sp.]
MSESEPSHSSAQLLSLPTDQLLEKFGSGNHKPGSGSAAALLGLLSCKLLQTVVSLTKDRAQYQEAQPQLTLANQQVADTIEPFLIHAVQQDAIHFDRVIQARRSRDAEKDPKIKRQLRDRARAELRVATEIPMAIAEHSLELADKAFAVFDLGFKSARGDSGVAISAALSGATGALFIVFLNLASFGGSEWAIRMREKAHELQARAQRLQLELFKRVQTLQHEAEQKAQLNEE